MGIFYILTMAAVVKLCQNAQDCILEQGIFVCVNYVSVNQTSKTENHGTFSGSCHLWIFGNFEWVLSSSESLLLNLFFFSFMMMSASKNPEKTSVLDRQIVNYSDCRNVMYCPTVEIWIQGSMPCYVTALLVFNST